MTASSRMISPIESAVIFPLRGFLTESIVPEISASTSEYSNARSAPCIVQWISFRFFTVAERLRAGNFTVDQRQPFGKPPQIFPFYNGIGNGDVLAVPECVFRIKNGIPDRQILHILKRIFSFHPDPVERNGAAVQQKIF